jgi:gag-polypeptide of LTR copia-type
VSPILFVLVCEPRFSLVFISCVISLTLVCTHFLPLSSIFVSILWALELHLKLVQDHTSFQRHSHSFFLHITITMVEIQGSKVIQLAADGSNWVNYHDRMMLVIRSHKWKDHLTNDSPTTHYVDGGTINGVTPKEQWEDNEAALINLIALLIPDSAFNKIKNKTKAKEVWTALKDLHEEQSPMVAIEL